MKYKIVTTEPIGVRQYNMYHIKLRPKGFECTVDEREYSRISQFVELIELLDTPKAPIISKPIEIIPEEEVEKIEKKVEKIEKAVDVKKIEIPKENGTK